MVLIILALLTVIRRRLRTTAEALVIDDEQALRQAEADLEQAPKQKWVVVAQMSSTQGFDVNNVLELINYLNSEGFEVSYDSTIVGLEGGAISNYLIRVPEDQRDRAKWYIQRRGLKTLV